MKRIELGYKKAISSMTFIPDYMYYYYPELVVNDAQDWTTWTLNLVSSLISALACATIIYVIYRSAQGLSTTYHRIIAYFATSLMMANIGAGLGTIPMPKDNIYPFKGPSLGNDATCTAQAFFLMFALINHVLCNVHLAWYYVAILVLKLKEKTVERYVEPFMLITNLAWSISISVYFYKVDYYHVDPLIPYCSPARYPFHCTWIPGEECDDNGTFMYTAEGYDALVKGSNIFLYVVFSLVVLAMLIIIFNTLIFELKSKKLSSTSHRNSSSHGRRTQISRSSNERVYGSVEDGSRGNSEVGITASDLKFTRIVSFQATLYIVSFLISYSPTVASLAKDYPESGFFVYWRIFISSFQGVFVLMIFLYHKVHNIMRRQRDVTIMDALATVFLNKDSGDDFFVENLTLVQESDDIRKRREAAKQEELENAEVHMEKSKGAKSSKIANSAELELYDGVSFSSPSRPESGRYDNISFDTSNVPKDVKETSLNNNGSNAMSFGQVSSTGILSYGPEGIVDGRKSSLEIENGKRYYDFDLNLDDESC